MEEERRLAYVALTRAKKRLYCTYIGQCVPSDRTEETEREESNLEKHDEQRQIMSRFLDSIPNHLVESCSMEMIVPYSDAIKCRSNSSVDDNELSCEFTAASNVLQSPKHSKKSSKITSFFK